MLMQFVMYTGKLHICQHSFFTLRGKLSGAVFSNRSCLFVCGVCVFVCECYYDNSKLRVSIFTKLGL